MTTYTFPGHALPPAASPKDPSDSAPSIPPATASYLAHARTRTYEEVWWVAWGSDASDVRWRPHVLWSRLYIPAAKHDDPSGGSVQIGRFRYPLEYVQDPYTHKQRARLAAAAGQRRIMARAIFAAWHLRRHVAVCRDLACGCPCRANEQNRTEQDLR